MGVSTPVTKCTLRSERFLKRHAQQLVTRNIGYITHYAKRQKPEAVGANVMITNKRATSLTFNWLRYDYETEKLPSYRSDKETLSRSNVTATDANRRHVSK